MNASPLGDPVAELAALVSRARDGDRGALEALIRRYQHRIAKFVVSETGDDAHYEDICQTAFVNMVLALPRLERMDRFEPWLYQIARNVCRDHLRWRHGWRRLFVAYDSRHETVAAAEPQCSDRRMEHIEFAIESLPARQRELLKLSLERRRSYDELSEISRASVSSVKSLLHRARETLREALLKEQSK